AALARFKNSRVYTPSDAYNVGQRIVFPALDYAIGVVVKLRPGNNPAYQDFQVIGVEFEDDGARVREFAAALRVPHTLNQQDTDLLNLNVSGETLTADDILNAAGDDIIYTVENALQESGSLVQVAGKWFPRDLMAEVNVGHINLAEAVLDINSTPLSTEDIVQQIGGLGSGSTELQVFSMNNALRSDERFDELGPTGEVLWYLLRLEPPEVRSTPSRLQYTPIEYDHSLLTPDMVRLEAEIDDELSAIPPQVGSIDTATVNLIYPHRRLGTLPLNAKMRQIFPTARQTPRVYTTLIDGQDGEEFAGWVVRKERYVFGLSNFYRKHRLPIGAFVTARHSEQPGKIVVDFNAYRPRTEWIRLITPKNNQISFENHKRSIGAEYDDLMILGADDLAGVDGLFDQTSQQRRPLVSILRGVIPALARLTPQATAHAKTIYSAVNVLKRCPPGPIFAALIANPDFQNVGGDYWKLADS
ncbi:MAG: hypothetical protein K8I30_19530, partial [Anaerolineae bacterium]|nr:hypothetical protein [Anaerolineae bacterium]